MRSEYKEISLEMAECREALEKKDRKMEAMKKKGNELLQRSEQLKKDNELLQ